MTNDSLEAEIRKVEAYLRKLKNMRLYIAGK